MVDMQSKCYTLVLYLPITSTAFANVIYRVKLAVDLNSNKQVAIKFLKVHAGGSRRKALDCLHKEIKILAECEHPNIAKIIEASFEGIIVKESITNESGAKQNEVKDEE
jgi:serine/threonine protein kinase